MDVLVPRIIPRPDVTSCNRQGITAIRSERFNLEDVGAKSGTGGSSGGFDCRVLVRICTCRTDRFPEID